MRLVSLILCRLMNTDVIFLKAIIARFFLLAKSSESPRREPNFRVIFQLSVVLSI